MPDDASPGLAGFPILTVVFGALFVIVALIIWLLVRSTVVAAWIAWPITIVWLLFFLTFLITDLGALSKTSLAAWLRSTLHLSEGAVDNTVFNRWSIVHGGAGVIMGLWYFPLVYVPTLTIVWELYEWQFKGVGDKEEISNRISDVGLAWLGWAAMVALVWAAKDAPIPIFARYMH